MTFDIICHNIGLMKYYDWNEDKNKKLKIERGVGFEDIISAIQENRLILL